MFYEKKSKKLPSLRTVGLILIVRRCQEMIMVEIACQTGMAMDQRRTIETQSWLSERFKKAVGDAEPIVLAPKEAQQLKRHWRLVLTQKLREKLKNFGGQKNEF